MSGAARVRRFAGVVALAGLALLGVSGCGGGGGGSGSTSSAAPAAGGTLHVSQGEEVITLDPLEALDLSSVNVVSQIEETLFRVTASGENEPWLVSGVEKSPDQKVWTLRLRQGVKFSNGDPMTSADVLFTLEQARKSANWSSVLEGIAKVTAPSPETIVIANRKPAPELPAILSQWSFGIVPKGYGGATAKEFAQHPIGTGPFMLGSWKRGESLMLDRNPHYWGDGQPYLDEVVFQAVPDSNSRVSQLKGGQLDVVYSPPWAQIAALESAPELEVGEYPLGFSEFLILNTRRPLFADKRVREAVDLAVNREDIVGAATNGLGEPAGSWFAPTVPYQDASIEPTARDVAKAKQLLAAAVGDGIDPSFTLATRSENSFWATAAQIVQQNLEEVGFEVKLQSFDEASMLELLGAGDFDAGALELYDAVPSPSEPIAFYNGFEGLWSGAPTTKTTKLAEAAASEVDPGKRERLYHEFQQVLAEEKAILPLVYLPFVWAHRTAVTGFTVGTTGTPWFAETGFAE